MSKIEKPRGGFVVGFVLALLVSGAVTYAANRPESSTLATPVNAYGSAGVALKQASDAGELVVHLDGPGVSQAPDGGLVQDQATAVGEKKVSVSAGQSSAYGEALCGAWTADAGPTCTAVGGLAGRRAITLYNLGSAQVRICTSASCGSGNSFPLDPGMSMALDVTDAIALCCGAASAQTAGSGLRYLEVR